MKKTLLILTMSLVAPLTIANEINYDMSMSLRTATLSVDSQYDFYDSDLSFDNINIGYGLAASMRFDEQLFLQASYSVGGSFNFLSDKFNLRQLMITAGYRYSVNDYLNLVPKAGLTFWDVDAKESRFLQDPEGAQQANYDGIDPYLALELEFPIGETFKLGIEYEWSNIEIGSTRGISLGFGVNF